MKGTIIAAMLMVNSAFGEQILTPYLLAKEFAWEDYQAEVKRRVEEKGIAQWFPELNEIQKLSLVDRDMLELMNLISTSEEAFELRASIQEQHQTGSDFCLLNKAKLHLLAWMLYNN